MKQEALESAFCIATDATGIAVQPEQRADGARQPCRRGHYFVLLADRDHVLFEYTAKETSAFVAEMLKGLPGYVQADAKNVYDVLFREPDKPPPGGPRQKRSVAGPTAAEVLGGGVRQERGRARGAGAHRPHLRARRRLARRAARDHPATAQRAPAPAPRGLLRLGRGAYEKVRDERGPLRAALGYAVRQKDALLRVLDDGRLVLENNRSERALRRIATRGSLCVTPSSARKPKRPLVRGIATWATATVGACA